MCGSWTHRFESLERDTVIHVARCGDQMLMDDWHGACPKIVGCLLGVITYLHKASFLHWAAFTDRSRTFAKRTLEHLALRPIWDDQGGPASSDKRGGVRWMCVWMCVWREKGREELGGVGRTLLIWLFVAVYTCVHILWGFVTGELTLKNQPFCWFSLLWCGKRKRKDSQFPVDVLCNCRCVWVGGWMSLLFQLSDLIFFWRLTRVLLSFPRY